MDFLFEMMLFDTIDQIKALPNCRVYPVSGLPAVAGGQHVIPDDLAAFYGYCGGMDMFVDKEFGFHILRPEEVVPANPVLLGKHYVKYADECDADRSSAWYLIAKGVNSNQVITIDFSRERSGRCYDSFWDVYATGDSKVVAKSFTELIHSLVNDGGEDLFWENRGFDLGFAYDDEHQN